MNSTPSLTNIVEVCLRLDQLSQRTYRQFSKQAESPSFSQFWERMAREEATHVSFWSSVYNLKEVDELPLIFDEPDLVLEELTKREADAKAIIADSGQSPDTRTMFLVALRLEFFLLHPAIGTLFQYLGSHTNMENPGKVYDQHIQAFLEELLKCGLLTPELELIGKSLERLWADNRKLAQLARLATRDYLTGLLNRRGFKEMAYPLATLAARNLSLVSILMIDIDNFKQFNDRFGHKTGDEVICAVADAMIASLRASDLLCRWGGEEFIVLLPSTEAEAALQAAEKLMVSIRKIQEKHVGVTVSIGVAGGPLSNSCEQDLEKLIERADAALYMAKERGRDQCALKQGPGR